eukprot:1983038-Prymnesium_polylepis.1
MLAVSTMLIKAAASTTSPTTIHGSNFKNMGHPRILLLRDAARLPMTMRCSRTELGGPSICEGALDQASRRRLSLARGRRASLLSPRRVQRPLALLQPPRESSAAATPAAHATARQQEPVPAVLLPSEASWVPIGLARKRYAWCSRPMTLRSLPWGLQALVQAT